jgi:hypothetical protein
MTFSVNIVEANLKSAAQSSLKQVFNEATNYLKESFISFSLNYILLLCLILTNFRVV